MLHLFQLEHYEAARLRVWVRRRGARVDSALLGPCAAAGGALTLAAALDADVLVLVLGRRRRDRARRVSGHRVLRRPQTKPLVFTARARRLFGVALAMPALVLAARRRSPCSPVRRHGSLPRSARRVAMLAMVGAPELLFAADTLVRPVQALDNRRFVQRAQRKLAEIDPLVVGITGSFGKTTTKACVAAVAELRGPAYATPASFNTYLGVVRAINEGLTAKHRTFIAEMGAYRLGDVAELCELVHPTIGVLTAIGPAHLERFGSLDAIEQAKGELAEALPADGVFVTTRRRRALPAHDRAHRGAAWCCSAPPDARTPTSSPRSDRDGRGHDALHAAPGRRGGHRAHPPARPPQRREPARRRRGRHEPRPPAGRDRAGARARLAARPPARADPQPPGRHRRDRRRLQLEPGGRRRGARGARVAPGRAQAARDARHGRARRPRGRGERALRRAGGRGVRPRGAGGRGALEADPRRPDRRLVPRLPDPRGGELPRRPRRCSRRPRAAATWCCSRTTFRTSTRRTSAAARAWLGSGGHRSGFRADDAAGSSGRRPVRRPLGGARRLDHQRSAADGGDGAAP